MKKFSKKAIMMLVITTLLLTFSVGSTVAFLVDKADEVENTFKPASATTDIVEVIDGTKKTSITISNAESSIDVYVRVAIIANWINDEGQIMGTAPLTVSLKDTWFKGNDGYYYHKAPVKANTSSSEMLANPIELTKDSTTGYRMQVTIIHQSIQAQPTTTVDSVWNVTLSGDQITSQP